MALSSRNDDKALEVFIDKERNIDPDQWIIEVDSRHDFDPAPYITTY